MQDEHQSYSRRGTRFLRCRARSLEDVRCALPVGHLRCTDPRAQWHAADGDGMRYRWRERTGARAGLSVLAVLLRRRA